MQGLRSTSALFWAPESGAQKRAEVLRNTCILGDPQTKGGEITMGSLTLDFPGAQNEGGSAT